MPKKWKIIQYFGKKDNNPLFCAKLLNTVKYLYICIFVF